MMSRHYPTMTSSQRRVIRQEYVREQNNCCYHCGKPFNEDAPHSPNKIHWKAFPGGQQGFLRYPIHLHHDHSTGMTIGAVHALCNAVLWQFHGE